jgi:phosphatidylserine decarboxylase
MDFFAIGDFIARLLLFFLPRRISNRIRENTSPLEVYVLRTATMKSNEPRMTLFEGVFATLLFDMALFGTSNAIINGIISFFTRIQNSWDTPFSSEDEAITKTTEFCNRLDIQQQPWIWEKEIQSYTSLNDFFSRTYAPQYFPKIGDGQLVSPACCKFQSFVNDESMKSILIKGCNYDVANIGLPEEDLDAYRKNRVILGYLSPKDYHRVHAPISVRIKGAYFDRPM